MRKKQFRKRRKDLFRFENGGEILKNYMKTPEGVGSAISAVAPVVTDALDGNGMSGSSIGSGIGGALGAAATFLGVPPQIGIPIGSAIGSGVGSGVDDLVAKKKAMKKILGTNSNNIIDNPYGLETLMALGGSPMPQVEIEGKETISRPTGEFAEYNGASHENGGIPYTPATKGEYVFSERLGTASLSKRINKKYDYAQDEITLNSKKKELNDLEEINELLKNNVSGRKLAFGGDPIKPIPQDPYFASLEAEIDAMPVNTKYRKRFPTDNRQDLNWNAEQLESVATQNYPMSKREVLSKMQWYHIDSDYQPLYPTKENMRDVIENYKYTRGQNAFDKQPVIQYEIPEQEFPRIVSQPPSNTQILITPVSNIVTPDPKIIPGNTPAQVVANTGIPKFVDPNSQNQPTVTNRLNSLKSALKREGSNNNSLAAEPLQGAIYAAEPNVDRTRIPYEKVDPNAITATYPNSNQTGNYPPFDIRTYKPITSESFPKGSFNDSKTNVSTEQNPNIYKEAVDFSKYINNDSLALGLKAAGLIGKGIRASQKPETEPLIQNPYAENARQNMRQKLSNKEVKAALREQQRAGMISTEGSRSASVRNALNANLQNVMNSAINQNLSGIDQANAQMMMQASQFDNAVGEQIANRRQQNYTNNMQNRAAASNMKDAYLSELTKAGTSINEYEAQKAAYKAQLKQTKFNNDMIRKIYEKYGADYLIKLITEG